MKKDRIISEGDGAPVARSGRKWLVRIAAVAVGAILLAAFVLMLNANVRSAVFGVFSGGNNGAVKNGSLFGVKIGYLPEGFAADRERAVVGYGKYDEPTRRRIDFFRESDLPYLDEPWAWEVEEFSGSTSPWIEVLIGRTGDPDVPTDLSEIDELYPEDITIRGMPAQAAYLGKIHEGQNAGAPCYCIMLCDENVTVIAYIFGFEDDEVIKIAEGITW